MKENVSRCFFLNTECAKRRRTLKLNAALCVYSYFGLQRRWETSDDR